MGKLQSQPVWLRLLMTVLLPWDRFWKTVLVSKGPKRKMMVTQIRIIQGEFILKGTASKNVDAEEITRQNLVTWGLSLINPKVGGKQIVSETEEQQVAMLLPVLRGIAIPWKNTAALG